jgi:hypothetical protein
MSNGFLGFLGLIVAVASIVVAPYAAPILFGVTTATSTMIAATGAILSFAGNAVIGAVASRDARRNADRAAQQQRADQLVSVRSATTPRRVVYGESIIGGTYAFADSTGTSNNELHIVLALCEGPIDSMLEVYIDDRPAGLASVDGNGWVTSGNFFKSDKTNAGNVQANANASGVWSATIPNGATIVSVTAYYPDDPIPVPVTYSVVGTTISGTASGHLNGRVAVDYTTSAGTPFLRLIPHLGSTTQAVDSVLQATFPAKITTLHQGQGIAYLYLVMVRDPSIYPNGVGNIKVRLRGKQLFDPRTNTTAFSSNPALVLRDYLITYVGASSSDFEATNFNAAANACDVLVASAGVPAAADFGVSAITRGSVTERRFSCDGVIELTQTPQASIDAILSSMSGSMSWSEGIWRIVPGTWTAPSITLTADDVIDYVSSTPTTPRSDLYNAVRGTFVNQSDGYISVDYPPTSSSTYATSDGATLWTNLNLPMTRSVSTAQRLARLHLERGRRQTTARLRCNLRQAFALQVLDRVSVTLSRFGWSARTFMVVGWEWTAPGVVELTLRADDAAAYSWDYTLSTSFPPPVASNLPNPWARSAVIGLTATSGALYARRRSDGVAVQGVKVSWNAQTNPLVLTGGFIEVQYKSGADTEFSAYAMQAGNSTSCVIEPVAVGSAYVFRARTVNQQGVLGEFAYLAHTVSGSNSIIATRNSNNLIPNSQLLAGISGWDFQGFTGTNRNAGVNFTGSAQNINLPDWMLAGSGTVWMQETGYRPGNGVVDLYFRVIPDNQANVQPGERFELSGYVQPIDCNAYLQVAFYDRLDNYATEIIVASKSNDGWPVTTLAGWGARIGGFFTVPSTLSGNGLPISKAMLFLRKNGKTGGGNAESYVFGTMFYMGRAGATQTELSPWVDGPVYDVSTGLIVENAATQVYRSGVEQYQFSVGTGQPGGATIYTLPDFVAPVDATLSATANLTCFAYFEFTNNTVFGDQDVVVNFLCRNVTTNTLFAGNADFTIVCAPPSGGSWVKNSAVLKIEGPLVAGNTYRVYLSATRSNWDGSKYLNCSFYGITVRAEVIKR